MSNVPPAWKSKTAAYTVPFLAFMVFLMIKNVGKVDNDLMPWWRFRPEQWVYPLQSIVCLGILAFYWKHYTFKPFKGLGLGALAGLIGIIIWVVPSLLYGPMGVADWPQWQVKVPMLIQKDTVWSLLGLTERLEGFDATFFKENTFWYVSAIVFRFIRMVIVVALVEEIFWRGFLMRYLIDMDKPFWKTPFGTFKAKPFWIVTLLFMLAHHPSDWLGALIFGAMANWLAIKTKSLAACVIMHAVANLVLGIFVMKTGWWGFW